MKSDRKNILVVEDDAGQRQILEHFLERRGYDVRSAPDAEGALALLDGEATELVLMDVRMPGMGGLEGLRHIRARFPTVVVILLTAYADVRDAVAAMRQGAADYLEKPIDLGELATVVAETIGGPADPAPVDLPRLPEDFVATSQVMRRTLSEVALVAPTGATVLITGESGTGKEKVAELVHNHSPRHKDPFVRVNCASIPETLVESELFGHTQGAFTGAERDRLGRFETAGHGTILLDEVGELPLAVQPKLLRVLEDGSFERVGESVARKAEARVIACTNRDLEREVTRRRFRQDLFWRLNVFRLHVPPLRDRTEEIPLLVKVFLARAGKEKTRVSPAALRLLESHTWPGNVRELANVVERAAILAAGQVILAEHLPDSLLGTDPRTGETREPRAPPETADSEGDAAPGPLTVEEAERLAIRDALRSTGGNRTQAAKLLGISRRTLLYRLKRYGGEP